MNEKRFRFIEPNRAGTIPNPCFSKTAQFRSPSEMIVDEAKLYRKTGGTFPVKFRIPLGKNAQAMVRGVGKLCKKKMKGYTARIDTKGKTWIIKI